MDISILPKDFSYLAEDEYSEFDEEIYKKIKCTSFDKYQKYMSDIYSQRNLSYNCKLVNNFQYNFTLNKLDFLCTMRYTDVEIHASFILQENGISIDFIDFDELSKNLDRISGRYYPLLCMITIPSGAEGNTGHCALFVFDTIYKKVYLVDSNGDIVTYYAKYFEDAEITNIHFTECLTQLFNNIQYTYVCTYHNKITKMINYKNEEINQKIFFNGYCVAWSVLFTELFLMDKNQDMDVADIVKGIYSLSKISRNELINRYHCNLFLNFLSQQKIK